MVPTRPLLDVIVAQDLRLDVRRRDHGLGPVPSCRGRASTAEAAAQEPKADGIRAAATAPVAVRGQSPGPFLRGSCVARDDHRRAERQQIIRRRLG